jgi:monothiol glutaredoxin
MSLDETTREQIGSLIQANDVMLFMKGNRQAPQCGFSATVCGILDTLASDYGTADVLADPALRDGIKTYSSWPTVPQLYVKGEFIGGCDIIQELYGTGELHAKFGIELDPNARPNITVSPAAADALRDATGNMGADGRELHLVIDARYEATLQMAPRAASDIEIESAATQLLIDPLSASRAEGVSIDAIDSPRGKGFKIDNPNAPDGA